MADFCHCVELAQLATFAGESKPKPWLRPQELKDIFNLPEGLARNRKVVQRQDLISSPKTFLLRVAGGMNASDVTAVANHLQAEAIPGYVNCEEAAAMLCVSH